MIRIRYRTQQAAGLIEAKDITDAARTERLRPAVAIYAGDADALASSVAEHALIEKQVPRKTSPDYD
ncbi:hypothetical protein EQZ23_06500 [Sphingomonas sp. UV9]|uniref:hypothetical protein n=1 Tax=Sphingomonas sp. UV9 TaxID=1851410 RepID=UPI000FFCA491|nr:hypothetical protein [Sphingomonas sp. UV9]RXD04802.1 hypothetical protein EQZ23_06500 [Sphingomonas sp. UV9]